MGEEGANQAMTFSPQYKRKEKDLRGRGRGQSSKGLHSSVCTNRVPATDPKVLYQKCYSRPFPILKTVLGSASEAPPRCVPPGIADLVSKGVYMLSRLLLWAFSPSQSDHTCHLLQLTQHQSSQVLGYSRGRKLVLTSSVLRRYLTSRVNSSYSSLIPHKRQMRGHGEESFTHIGIFKRINQYHRNLPVTCPNTRFDKKTGTSIRLRSLAPSLTSLYP